MAFIDFPTPADDRQGRLRSGSASLSNSIKYNSPTQQTSIQNTWVPKTAYFSFAWMPLPTLQSDSFMTQLLPYIWKLKQ